MSYKVGDKVIIRHDLIATNRYGGVGINSNMVNLSGKVATIKHISFHYLRIDIDSGEWNWTKEMFLPYIPSSIEELDDMVINKGYKPTKQTIENVLKGVV